MDWLGSLFTVHSSIQTVVVISLICALGLALGKLRFFGISLGSAFVFFIGIIAGHFGLRVDAQTLDYIETFGLSLFVYMLGLSVGPNFFGSLRHEGIRLNLWSLAVILSGTLMAGALCEIMKIPMTDMIGLLCGATTNTPALGAAQQALLQMSLPTGGAALGCAVTYPLGVVGVILAMVLLRKLFVRPDDLKARSDAEEDHTYVGQFVVINPALDGKTLAQVSAMTHFKFIISRIWRGKQVIVPLSTTQLHTGDNVMMVITDDEVEAITLLFGKQVETDWNAEKVDWNRIDKVVESKVIVVSRTELNGKQLGRLQLRSTYGVNVSRVVRGDITLLATNDLRLQYGDRVTVVGEHDDVEHVERFFGNAVQLLNEPNLGSIFFGVLIGLIVGAIPLNIPGMSAPVRLGIAGGPIVVGILVGSLGPRTHFISYTTRSASLMLRKLGLSVYLACLGLDAGSQFFETIVRPEGLLWVGVGFLITLIPVLLVGLVALRMGRLDFGSICGILCGSMANPMALTYANDTIKGEMPAVSYASVYPLGMFVRVIIAQMLIMFFT